MKEEKDLAANLVIPVTEGWSWRTEPEIDAKRQAELAARRSITPDVERGIYPFKNVKLNRADIEWLLATHENGYGPIDYYDPSQCDRVGLDLRGADLSYAVLQNLPLARTLGDVAWHTWTNLTEKQHYAAAVQLQYADLKGAHLEGAELEYANLEGADLRDCHLEKANLGIANMQKAYLDHAHLEGADLRLTRMDNAYVWHTYLQGTRLREAHFDGSHLDHPILASENQIGPQTLDVCWGETVLATVDWSQVRMLGDEYKARQKDQDGQPKNRETRLGEFEEAVRANRQLALALRSEGLNEHADRFVYRSQVLQRQAYLLLHPPRLGSYFVSLMLGLLTGYGYRMWRMIAAYVLLTSFFALLYYSFGLIHPPHINGLEAFILSITAFHGRVFTSPFQLDSPQGVVTACEAICGILFEGIFIAMLTQRFFGK